MELSKQALEHAKFRARGKWYLAREVDRFLEELTVGAAQAERELARLREENRTLVRDLDNARQENRGLEEKLLAAQQAPAPESLRQPEQERDQLIADIKALRRFREAFRQAVTQDAQSLLEQAGALGSEKLL